MISNRPFSHVRQRLRDATSHMRLRRTPRHEPARVETPLEINLRQALKVPLASRQRVASEVLNRAVPCTPGLEAAYEIAKKAQVGQDIARQTMRQIGAVAPSLNRPERAAALERTISEHAVEERLATWLVTHVAAADLERQKTWMCTDAYRAWAESLAYLQTQTIFSMRAAKAEPPWQAVHDMVTAWNAKAQYTSQIMSGWERAFQDRMTAAQVATATQHFKTSACSAVDGALTRFGATLMRDSALVGALTRA